MKYILAVAVLWGTGLAFAQGSAPPVQAQKKAEPPARPPPPDVSRLPFSPDSIREVMQYHSRDLQDCYEEMLAMKGSNVVEGRILTRFTITPEGFVRNARVAKGSKLKDARFHECVASVLSSMTFPQPPDGREYPIEYPFNLKAIK